MTKKITKTRIGADDVKFFRDLLAPLKHKTLKEREEYLSKAKEWLCAEGILTTDRHWLTPLEIIEIFGEEVSTNEK
mgnify:FL=1